MAHRYGKSRRKQALPSPCYINSFQRQKSLYRELLVEHLDAFCSELESIFARDDDYLNEFCSVVDLYERTFAKGAKTYHIIQREISGNGRFFGFLTRKYFSRIFLKLADFLKKGMREGIVRPLVDSRLAGFSFSSILLFYFSQGNVLKQLSWYAQSDTFSERTFRAHIFKLFLDR